MESESRRTGGKSCNLVAMVDRAPPAGHPSPPAKAREKLVRLNTLAVPNI